MRLDFNRATNPLCAYSEHYNCPIAPKPNHLPVAIRAGAICIGRLEPGTSLVDILYQVFEIIVYRKFNAREYDCLNKAACTWARNNQGRFPTDPRSLKRPAHSAKRVWSNNSSGALNVHDSPFGINNLPQ